MVVDTNQETEYGKRADNVVCASLNVMDACEFFAIVAFGTTTLHIKVALRPTQLNVVYSLYRQTVAYARDCLQA